MNIIIKKAIAVLAATTIVLAPMQAFAQTQDVVFCTNSWKGCATIPVASSWDPINIDWLPDYVKASLKKIEGWVMSDAQYFEIEGEKILFARVEDSNKSTKAYFPKGSPFRGKFATPNPIKEGAAAIEAINEMVNKGEIDLQDPNLTIAPHWVTPNEFDKGSAKNKVLYHSIAIGEKEGYTIKTADYGWFVAFKKDASTSSPAPTTPTTPQTFDTTPFYTSNDKEFEVVLSADKNSVDTEKTVEYLKTRLNDIAKEPELLALANEFIQDPKKYPAEIKDIEGGKVLFIKVGDNNTKAYRSTSDLLGNDKAFTAEGATKTTDMPTDADIDNAILPSWVSDKNDIIRYQKTNEGYVILTKSGHYYYAPKKKKTSVNTGGSGGGGSYTPSTPVVTPTTPSNPTTEVKGDEIVRPTAPIFANFTKKCEQNVKNLSDPRLVDYYDVLKVENKTNLDRALTRAEFLKLVLNSANVDVSNESVPTYSDVPATHTLKNYIAYATRTNMISGQNGKFRPDDIITRAEAAKIFVNAAALGLSTEIKTFADVDAKHSLAAYIQTAYDNCLLHGRKTVDGNPVVQPRVYEPSSAITLAETAKVLYNIVH